MEPPFFTNTRILLRIKYIAMGSLSSHYFILTTEFFANLHGRVYIVFFPELSLLSKISLLPFS